MKKKKYFLLTICLIFLIASSLLLVPVISKRLNILKKIKREVTIEYGTKIQKEDFLKENIEKIEFLNDLNNYYEVGNYKIKVKIEEQTFTLKLHIKDTTAPEIELKDLKIYKGETLPSAKDFVVEVKELSDYVIEGIEIPDSVGQHSIEITVTDRYANRATKKALLEILEDTEGPTFDGLSDLVIELGKYANLLDGVTAFDQKSGTVPFTYDDTEVNYKEPGTYKIYYEATDANGNTTKKERKITIIPMDVEVMIENFPTFYQYPDYPNGCESAALYNLLRYYKINVTMEEIVEELKKGDSPYLENDTLYGGDPEIEFVGDPRSPYGYGVYQKPIIEVANKWKKGMIDYTGHTLDEVLEIVKQKIPVQVWASIHLKDTKVCTSWIYRPTGKKIEWICDLHSMVIVGYNRKSIYVSDSYTGNIEKYDREQFEKMYNLFGQRAIYYKE